MRFFRETWTSNVWTMMTMMTISKLSQHNQFPTHSANQSVPELSRKLQLEHHQCIRLLKAVYGLVNAPRRWYHRVATDLRNLTGAESVMDESRVFKQCGAQITQAYTKHTGTWSGFEISFTEYVKEISIITLPSHRRREKIQNHTT